MEKKYVELNDQNFENEVLKSDQTVIVDFGAEWCGPCKMIVPIIEELASEYSGKVKVGKIDVDDNAFVTSKYGIKSLPTILFFKNGEVVDKIIGAVPKKAIVEKLVKAA